LLEVHEDLVAVAAGAGGLAVGEKALGDLDQRVGF
jgi:hypothetical protein